ncbi:MAG: type IV toxin-antitoxin system AbiEi family antitoxin [Dehalococcoidia bacterium]|nr:type IV toxin-antitoxin system AbiEi family antitoxin [Dehalococcoidia bacterium]
MTLVSVYYIISPSGENNIIGEIMKEFEVLYRIKEKLEQTLRDIPFIEIRQSTMEAPFANVRVDLLVEFKVKNRFLKLVVEVKSLGEPRLIRSAIQQIKEYMGLVDNAYALVAAPYISEDTARICKQNKVGYIDLAGNLFLNFDQVYIEKKGYPNPIIEKRQVRSIFCAKSSRILRVMFNNPGRSWQVQELAREANVSLGLVSRVKERLLDLEYAREKDRSLILSRPRELLEQWVNNYSFRANKIYDYFSFDEPRVLERKMSQYCKQRKIPYALTLFSGAALVAPFARYTRGFAYVIKAIKEVADSLGLKGVSSGPNFSLLEPYDEGVFAGSREIDEMRVVGDIQLYLDLVGFKGRGEESAQFLFEQKIKPHW